MSLDPTQLTVGSERKAWWKCSKEHEWQATIDSKNKGHGCPFCSGRRAIKGKNDLQTLNSILANEWNYNKNGELKPYDFSANSHKKVWWMCSKGHEWQARIAHRNNGSGCPYCSGRYTIQGENDFQATNPTLAKEWNFEKNIGLMPSDLMPNSNKKVWWKCKKGHEWQATINHRNRGRGCPTCNSERKTSFPEYAFLYYLKKHGLEVIHSYRENGYELDIYIPSRKIAIEYDGYYWHKSRREQDLEKNQKCIQDGIKLYRIRDGLPPLNDSSIDYDTQENRKNLSTILMDILSEITGMNVDVDLIRDAIAIENLREYTEKENSLLFLNPKVAKEWNYQRNGNLLPENLPANSNKKVWWKCKKGHEWQATIHSRNNGCGCPYCSNQRVSKGYNDLATLNPELAKEWHNEKNGDLTPAEIMPASNKKVWWRCNKGHEWQAVISSRNIGCKCPYCTNRKVLEGYNDLQTINPNLAKEWNFEKNIGLTPQMVMPGSDKKVWWRCEKGHEWQAGINSRNRGNGCPICSSKRR